MRRTIIIILLFNVPILGFCVGMPTPTVPKVLPNTPYGAKIPSRSCGPFDGLRAGLPIIEVKQAAQALAA